MARIRTLAAIALLVALAGCGGEVSAAYRSHLPTEPPAAPGPGQIAFTGAGFEMNAPAQVGEAAARDAWAGVLATLDRYLDVAVVAPLRSGGGAGPLDDLFTASAARRVASSPADRAALVDEGLPKLERIRKQRAVATLAALADRDGSVRVVSVDVDLRLLADLDGEQVTIARAGELVLVPEGGAWRIDSYDLRASRDSPPVPAS